MRYLRLCLRHAQVPSAEELQIVTSWVLERTAENGRVLIQDGHARFNDGLVAVASLIKGGLPAHLALLALRRAMPGQLLRQRPERRAGEVHGGPARDLIKQRVN